MATEELRIVITAQDRASQVMQNMARQMTTTAQSMERLRQSSTRGAAAFQGFVTGITTAAATRGLSIIEGIVEGIARATFGFSASMEQSRIAWSTLLGGSEQANAMLGQLQKFARETPFEFPDVERAAKRLLAMGFAARDIIPLMKDIGNAASALGVGAEGVDRIALALGQMRTRTKVAAEEMMQLTDIGVPAWEILARATGRSVAEIQDAVSKGQVSAETFIKAFQQFAQSRYGGLMEQQSKTFAGAMSNIKDSLVQIGANAFQPVFEMLRDMAVAFADFLQSPGVQAFNRAARTMLILWTAYMRAIWGTIGNALEAIGKLFGSAWEFISNVVINALNAIGEAWNAFWNMLGTTGEQAFGQLLNLAAEGWGKFVDMATAAFRKLLEGWANLIAFLRGLRAAGVPLIGIWGAIADQTVDVDEATQHFSDTLKNLPGIVSKFVMDAFQKIKQFLSEDVWKQIQDAWEAAGVDMTDAAADLGDKVGGALGGGITEGVQKAAKPLQETLNRLFAELRAGPAQQALEDVQYAIQHAQAILKVRGFSPEERHEARRTIRDLTRNVLPGRELEALEAGRSVTLATRPEQQAQLLQQIADTQREIAEAAKGPIALTVNINNADGSQVVYRELLEANGQARTPSTIPQSGIRFNVGPEMT